MNMRRFVGGLSFLLLLAGGLLVSFIPGGFFIDDPLGYRRRFDHGLHITGFVLISVAAVGFVILFSLNKPATKPTDRKENI